MTWTDIGETESNWTQSEIVGWFEPTGWFISFWFGLFWTGIDAETTAWESV